MGWVIQVRIESELGIKLLTHQGRVNNGIFSLNLPNANGHRECNFYQIIVLTGYSFTVLELKPPFFI